MNVKLQNNFVSEKAEKALYEHVSELNSKGKNIPTSIEEIAEFPYKNFQEIQNALENRSAILLRFSFDYLGSIAQTLNPSLEWTINLIITFLLPLLSVVLSIFYSWWFIFGLLFFFVGQSRTKKLYNNTIFKSAMTNEAAFCFLFYARQISISTPDRNTQYFYDPKNEVTKSL